MAFKRISGILEGNYIIEVTKVGIITYKDGRQALKLTVRTIEGDIIYGNFLIFTNNVYLMDKLINITYENPPKNEVNEEEFVGIYMEITTREKNGYMNIVDMNPVELVEDEDDIIVEEAD